MADWRFRLKRTDFGATLRGGFALKNSTDIPIVVGTPPVTPHTQAVLTGEVSGKVRLVT